MKRKSKKKIKKLEPGDFIQELNRLRTIASFHKMKFDNVPAESFLFIKLIDGGQYLISSEYPLFFHMDYWAFEESDSDSDIDDELDLTTLEAEYETSD